MLAVTVIQSLDVYFFAIFLLVLISIKVLNDPNGKTPQSRAFSLLLILNFLVIITDCTTILFDGKDGPTMRFLLMGATVFGYSLQAMICLCWFWYVREVVSGGQKQRTAITALQGIPAILCICAVLLSCHTGWIFQYSARNFYRRGPLFGIVAATSFLYLICGYFMIFKNWKKLEKRHLAALLSFALPPAIGGIIQTYVYGVSLLWPCMTFSILIIYMTIQNELLRMDQLTGINNRISFDYALKRRISTAKDSTPFALMLIDLDNFRSINDRYGHIEGDKVLQIMSQILMQCFHHNDFIARYGGDQFAVIIELQQLNDLYELRNRLHEKIDDWNQASKKPWKLSVSIGCAPYIPSEKLSQDHYHAQIEKLLCLDKIIPGDRRSWCGRRR